MGRYTRIQIRNRLQGGHAMRLECQRAAPKNWLAGPRGVLKVNIVQSHLTAEFARFAARCGVELVERAARRLVDRGLPLHNDFHPLHRVRDLHAMQPAWC